jgi:hypothetical protein
VDNYGGKQYERISSMILPSLHGLATSIFLKRFLKLRFFKVPIKTILVHVWQILQMLKYETSSKTKEA